MKSPERDDTPVLITAAERSYEEQFAERKRKYMIIMGMRIPLLIIAGLLYHTWWLALLVVLLSVPLPWCAVLIANDRPARKSETVSRYRASQGEPRSIESGPHQVIEG